MGYETTLGDTRDPWAEVTAVIVTYNSATVIEDCLAALGPGARVIVVDSASSDDTLQRVRRRLPTADVIENPVNVGYGRGNNQGIERVRTPYALILNPDVIVSVGAVAGLLRKAGENPSAAIVAPLLERPGGGLELPLMGPGEHRHRHAEFVPVGDFCTWFVTGAVLFCRLDAWRALGGFDEKIFLTNEDTDLCLRATRAGYGLVVTPDVRVRHLGGRSVAPTWRVRWIKDWHMTWSHLYVEARYGDAPVARRGRALAVGHGLRTLLYLLLLNPKKVAGNFAKTLAAVSFLLGRPAR